MEPEFRVWGLGFWGLGVWGLGFRVWGLGFRVWGLGLRAVRFGVKTKGAFGGHGSDLRPWLAECRGALWRLGCCGGGLEP